jgi:hypothetical protein
VDDSRYTLSVLDRIVSTELESEKNDGAFGDNSVATKQPDSAGAFDILMDL